MKQDRFYTKDVLENAVKDSISVSEVCRKLGKYPKGGTYELIKNRIKEYNIDTTHFLGYKSVAGKRNPTYERRRSKEEILKDGYKYRASHRILERALLESNIEYKCLICDLSNWLGSTITLDIDHIDGDWKNCNLNNLRFLCPNCHRQTKNFGSKNKKVL